MQDEIKVILHIETKSRFLAFRICSRGYGLIAPYTVAACWNSNSPGRWRCFYSSADNELRWRLYLYMYGMIEQLRIIIKTLPDVSYDNKSNIRAIEL